MKRKRNNLFALLVVTLTAVIFLDIPAYSDHNSELKTKRNKKTAKFLDSISIGNIPEKNKLISLEIANDTKNLKLIIKNVGFNSKVFSKFNEDSINFEITTIKRTSIDQNEQIIKIPSQGIIKARLYGKEKKYKLDIKLDDQIIKDDIQVTTLGTDIILSFRKLSLSSEEVYEKNMQAIAEPKSKKFTLNQKGAIAPPLGDIAIGTTLIPNPNLLNLKGPNVSLVFKQTQAKKALELLLSKANYGFVWVQKDPSYNPDGSSSSSIQTISNEGSNTLASSSMDPSLMGMSNSQSSDSSEANADSHRYITLTLKDVPFKNAFNAVLMASGMQAKLENGIVYVGPNVRESVFNSRISRVYRLNQTTANAAASYLANLGAKVTRTTTIETAVTQGAAQSSTVSGSATSSTTTSGSSTSVEVYGSDIGPLLGLIATTDDRLQTVTMIGSSDIVTVAEEYLKKLDLRQRQVALSVKILDVQLDDGTSISNSWAMRQNNNFIVNDSGKLITAFGEYLPPNEANDFTDSRGGSDSGFNNEIIEKDDSSDNPVVTTLSQVRRINPVNMYSNQTFIKFLRAQIVSKNTKILASPTLILNEFPGKSGGETVTFSDISEALSSGSIGRSYGNEGFVIVGNQLPINCTAEGDTASFEYGIAGLTFGARVLRIDDNGYVTFAISPSVSASSSTREITGCGIIDLLSVRRLDSGSIRVKDGNTLILTGVLNANDKETITKFPFFGDLPIIGHFFRNRVSAKDQRELVILVTPRLLDGSDSEFENINKFTSSYKNDY